MDLERKPQIRRYFLPPNNNILHRHTSQRKH